MQFDLVDKLRKMDVRYKTAVISAFLWGIASQGTGLFNKLSFHDDVMSSSAGATYLSGRWMLDLLVKAETLLFKQGQFSLPVFNGLIAIVLIAVSACLVVRILEIRNLFICSFIGGLMVSFPVITGLFGYMFTLHFYMFALLFAVLGAYYICRADKWYLYLVGIVLTGSSLGVYQPFFPAAVTLVLMYLIAYSAKADTSSKELLKKSVLSGLSLFAALAFYIVVNKAFLILYHISLNYGDVTTLGGASLSEYFRRAVYAYMEYFYPNKNAKYYMYRDRLSILYKLVVLISVLLSARLALRIYKKSRINAVICVVLMALLPVAVNLILVMVGVQLVHSLMVYTQLFPFVYLVWLLDNADWKPGLFGKGMSFAMTCLTVLILLIYCRYDNLAFLKATYAQSDAISYFTTLVTQIKETDGYTDELPVAFLNWNTDTSVATGDDDRIIVRLFPYSNVNGYLTNYKWKEFMWQWCGYHPTLADPQDFSDLEEVRNMPHYPDDGSIRVIDGTVIVNF